MRDLAIEYNIESINQEDKVDKTPVIMDRADCTDREDFEMEVGNKVDTLVEIYRTEGADPNNNIPVMYTRGYIRTNKSDKWIMQLLKKDKRDQNIHRSATKHYPDWDIKKKEYVVPPKKRT